MDTQNQGREHFANEAIIEIDDVKVTGNGYARKRLSNEAYRLFGKHTANADYYGSRMTGIYPQRDAHGTLICDAVVHAHKIAKKLMVAVGYTFNYRVERLN